ncbi:HAD family phosphatase [Clostridium sp. SYSU_GA19001]|uniref:HAD family hydrolase n=1 Tax=Clostridium caldaquaticum TaxID=2940653 RepID=UPI0020775B00|nr:HAD family phosphatase [Clostridium caldaquaticum]MCM8709498.1 HAD family phosphatase [Clostridium caldaquaticum]
MLTNIKAAIFDLDGTLIDSMYVWEKIDLDFLKARNLEVPEGLNDAVTHLNFIDTAKYFKKRFNLTEEIEAIMDEWNTMAYYEYANNIKLKPGAEEYLSFLKSKGIKLAIASSNLKSLIEIVLKNNKVYDYFENITTTLETERGKNFPDVYLLTAKKLQVRPEQCIVFEDIIAAVLGAKAAGMKVVGVYDKASHYQADEISANADYFIYNYEDLMKDM